MSENGATLDDIMNGIVEIPAEVQHYEIKGEESGPTDNDVLLLQLQLNY